MRQGDSAAASLALAYALITSIQEACTGGLSGVSCEYEARGRFRSQLHSLAKGCALLGLAILGFVVSLLWLHLVNWINPYVGMGHAAGKAAERRLFMGVLGEQCPHEGRAHGKCPETALVTTGDPCVERQCFRTFERAWHYQHKRHISTTTVIQT